MENAIVKSKIKEFREAFIGGIKGIVRAAEIYVEAIDEDPKAADQFRDECADWIPSSAWAGFEAVGRKWMHPRLIMGGVADRKKASHIKRLPYSVQERVFNNDRFELLVSGGDTLLVDLMEATPEQVEQLCGVNNIRTVSEQKAWLESKKVKEEAEPEHLPYIITNGSVSFRRGVTMTRSEIKRILQEM